MTALYAPLRKAETQDDGTLRIEGIASSESEDADGEIILASAVKTALPTFMAFANLREMHQLSAAGRVDSAHVGADGLTTISATVVDEAAIRKVRKNVYRGLSLGGRATKRDPKNSKIITALTISEISLVDRPANPDAVLTLFKADAPTPLRGFDKARIDAEVRKALAEMTPQERALLLFKATFALGGREISARF